MDDLFFKLCKEEESVQDEDSGKEKEYEFELMPCAQRFRLRAEDEISLGSVFSDMLRRVVPSADDIQKYDWGITAKDMLNEKQALLFEETLYISQLRDTDWKLCEEKKVFVEREMNEIGHFCCAVEESYDGFVVFSTSEMAKPKSKGKCGHTLKGKYDCRFQLICEKRTEFDLVDNARVEKHLEARNMDNDTLLCKRETRISGSVQKFRAQINVKGREDPFLLDGGVMLVMRYLIVNQFRGQFDYWSMNLIGKIVKCTLTVREERKNVSFFRKTFVNTIPVITSHYFDGVEQEVSETYFKGDGHIVLHFWHGYNYVLHCMRKPEKNLEKILPKLELMWRNDNILFKKYEAEKALLYNNAVDYMNRHPEISDFLNDYVLSLLMYKPHKILEYTVKFFQNMKDA